MLYLQVVNFGQRLNGNIVCMAEWQTNEEIGYPKTYNYFREANRRSARYRGVAGATALANLLSVS